MTQKEKIEMLKETITFLYEKEGRSKSYISRLLCVDRKTLVYKINEWSLIKANISYMKPSTLKFLNRNKQLILSRLNNDINVTDISKELGVSREIVYNIIEKDTDLNECYEQYKNRLEEKRTNKINSLKSASYYDYDFTELDGEEWKEILGYPNYYVSNMGRIKKYIKSYDAFTLLKPTLAGGKRNRYYISMNGKNLQVSRLVGFAFVDGHSEENNTIDHLDGNPLNNRADNLEWVSQAENNKRAYDNGRSRVKSYQKNGKFKKIILNDMYEFKTITALAKFCGVSWTQMNRYIANECKHDYKIEFIYCEFWKCRPAGVCKNILDFDCIHVPIINEMSPISQNSKKTFQWFISLIVMILKRLQNPFRIIIILLYLFLLDHGMIYCLFL